MLKIGVLGIGYFGKIYFKCIQLVEEIYELIGYYDFDDVAVWQVEEQYGVQCWIDLDVLIVVVDVIDIVILIIIYFEFVKWVIGQGKYLFIEKFLINIMDEVKILL